MSDYKHGEMDITAQEKAYAGFIGFTKWAVIALLILVVWMAIFIT